MNQTVPLSEAKARLSEIIRDVRRTRIGVTITVDGQPAARVEPTSTSTGSLTPAELATHQLLLETIIALPCPDGPYDAVEMIREGRR